MHDIVPDTAEKREIGLPPYRRPRGVGQRKEAGDCSPAPNVQSERMGVRALGAVNVLANPCPVSGLVAAVAVRDRVRKPEMT